MDIASQQPVLAGSLTTSAADQAQQPTVPPSENIEAFAKPVAQGGNDSGVVANMNTDQRAAREGIEDGANSLPRDEDREGSDEAADSDGVDGEPGNSSCRYGSMDSGAKSSLPPRKRRREDAYAFGGEGDPAEDDDKPMEVEGPTAVSSHAEANSMSSLGPNAGGPPSAATGASQNLDSTKAPTIKVPVWKPGGQHLTSPPPSLRGAAEILCGLSPLPDHGNADSKGSVSAEGAPSSVPILAQPKEGPFGRSQYRDQDRKGDDRDMDRERPSQDPRKKAKPFGGAPMTPAPTQVYTPPSRLSQVRTQGVAISRDQKPPPGACNHCMETESPQWRKGPPDKPHLCNACGTRYLRTGSLQHSGHRRGNAKAPSRGGGGSSSTKSQSSEGSNKARIKSGLARGGSNTASEAAAAMLVQDVSEGRTQRELRPRVPPPPPIPMETSQGSGDTEAGRARRRRANSSSQQTQEAMKNGGGMGGFGQKVLYDRGENSGMTDPTASPGESTGFTGGAKRVGGRRSMRRARRDVSNSADMWASPRTNEYGDGEDRHTGWGGYHARDDLMGDNDDDGNAAGMAAAGAMMGMAGGDMSGQMSGAIPSMAQLEAVAAQAATSHLQSAAQAGNVAPNPAAAAAAAAAAAMCQAMGLSAEVGAAAAAQAMRAFSANAADAGEPMAMPEPASSQPPMPAMDSYEQAPPAFPPSEPPAPEAVPPPAPSEAVQSFEGAAAIDAEAPAAVKEEPAPAEETMGSGDQGTGDAAAEPEAEPPTDQVAAPAEDAAQVPVTAEPVDELMEAVDMVEPPAVEAVVPDAADAVVTAAEAASEPPPAPEANEAAAEPAGQAAEVKEPTPEVEAGNVPAGPDDATVTAENPASTTDGGPTSGTDGGDGAAPPADPQPVSQIPPQDSSFHIPSTNPSNTAAT